MTSSLEMKNARDGFTHVVGRQNVVINGMRTTKTTVSNRPEEAKTVSRIGHGVVATLSTVANMSKAWREEHADVAFKGRATRDVYSKPKSVFQELREAGTLTEEIGFDPKSKESMAEFLNKPEIKGNLVESYGNLVWIVEDSKNNTSYAIVNYGMRIDPENIEFVSFSDPNSKPPEPLKGGGLHKAVHLFSLQLPKMYEKIEDLARKVGKKRGMSEDEIDAHLSDLKKEVRKEFKYVVVSHNSKHTRLLKGSADLNALLKIVNSSFAGVRVDWDEQIKKTAIEIVKGKIDDKLSQRKPFHHLLNSNSATENASRSRHPEPRIEEWTSSDDESDRLDPHELDSNDAQTLALEEEEESLEDNRSTSRDSH